MNVNESIMGESTGLVQKALEHDIFLGLLVALIACVFYFLIQDRKSREKKIEAFEVKLEKKNVEIQNLVDKYAERMIKSQEDFTNSNNQHAAAYKSLARLVDGINTNIKEGFNDLKAELKQKI